MTKWTWAGFWKGAGAALRAIPAALWWIGALIAGGFMLLWRGGRDARAQGAANEKARAAREDADDLADRVRKATDAGDDAAVEQEFKDQVRRGRKP